MAQASIFGFAAVATWAADGEPDWAGLDEAVLVSAVPAGVLEGD